MPASTNPAHQPADDPGGFYPPSLTDILPSLPLDLPQSFARST